MRRVFFTDRDLGRQFPDILEKAGLSVERHASHFADDCSDETWLQVIGKHGWVALTHDQRIRYKRNESDAVIRHRVTLLVIVGKAPHRDLAQAFVSTLPRIEAFLTTHSPPLIAKVYRPSLGDLQRNSVAPGRVEHWYP